MFFFYFRRSPLTYFAVIDWVLPFVFFNMSSPAHVTISAVHRLTLFACVCSWRRASINAVTQKEAAQRRHAKFTQLLTQSDEVRHWFQDAPCSLQKERESGRETGRDCDGFGGSRRSGEGEREWRRGEEPSKAQAFKLSACQCLMIELKYFCHERGYEKLFEKYSCFKVSAVTPPVSSTCSS